MSGQNWTETIKDDKAIISKNGKSVEFSCPDILNAQDTFFKDLAENIREFASYKDFEDMCKKRGLDEDDLGTLDAWRTECGLENDLKSVLGGDFEKFLKKYTG